MGHSKAASDSFSEAAPKAKGKAKGQPKKKGGGKGQQAPGARSMIAEEPSSTEPCHWGHEYREENLKLAKLWDRQGLLVLAKQPLVPQTGLQCAQERRQ